MTKEFSNKKNTDAADIALKSVIWVGFMLSTITSSVSLGFAIIPTADGFLASVIGEFYSTNTKFVQTISWGAISVVLFRMCQVVDFNIIATIGKFFATEAFAAFGSYKGVFARFSVFRSAAAIFAGLIFGAGFTLSFVTSVNGSNLIKAFVAPKVNAKQYDVIVAERDKQAVSATKLQDEKIAKLEANKKAAIANAGNHELKKQAKKGNAWANTELERQRTAAAKTYDRQIAATEKARTAAATAFEERYKGIEKAKIAAADADIEKTISQAGTIGALTKGFGVLPLIIGVLGMIILSISEVAAQAPAPTSAPRSKSKGNVTLTPPPTRAQSQSSYPNFH